MQELARLDDLIVSFARLYRSPGVRRALMRDVPGLASIANLRVLRAVEQRSRDGNQPHIGDIASDLEIEHSTASREVSAVVDRGFLVKTGSASDLRKTCLSLTGEGERVLNLATETRLGWLRDSTRNWSHAEVRRLTELLDRLLEDYGPRVEGEGD